MEESNETQSSQSPLPSSEGQAVSPVHLAQEEEGATKETPHPVFMGLP